MIAAHFYEHLFYCIIHLHYHPFALSPFALSPFALSSILDDYPFKMYDHLDCTTSMLYIILYYIRFYHEIIKSNHFSNAQNNAAPRFTQKLSSCSVLHAIDTTKFVEWPVVESVPALFFVLYKGISHTVV